MFQFAEDSVESFEQQCSSSVTQDYGLPDHNNTQIIGTCYWFQEEPSQNIEYSQGGNAHDEPWPDNKLWSPEISWNLQNPGRVNETFRDWTSEAPDLIPDKDSQSSRTGVLQVLGTTIEKPSSTASLTVTTIYACERCPQTFQKMYLLSRHKEIHNPAIQCPVNSCVHRTARPRDMNRHVAARHPEYVEEHVGRPLPRPICPVTGCKYAEIGFARKDHLKRHLRRKHSE